MRVQPRAVGPAASSSLATHQPLQLSTVVGLTYVVLTLLSSCVYMMLLQPAFSNDLWWTSFNVSTHQALLVDLVNAELITHANGSVDLLASHATVDKRYDSPIATTLISHPYVRALGLAQLTTIDFAVVNIRLLSSHHCMWLSTQFCYVDLSRVFEVAHTAARQQRCLDRYRTNGAMYMETVLRNQNWDAFAQNYGGDGGMFSVAVQNWLVQIPAGVAWLERTAAALPQTNIAQEAAYWRANGIVEFKLQWQNLWLMGISETFAVENALGIQQDVWLKNVPRMFQAWTSITMYWFPANDLNAMVGSNRSLVRSANNSFATAPAIDFQTFLGLQDMGGQNQVDAFRTTVGPFVSIDVFVVPVPFAVLTLYETFQTILFEAMDHDSHVFTALNRIVEFLLTPTPPLWNKPRYIWHGGNPLCFSHEPKPFIQESVDFYDNCATSSPLTVSFTKYSSVFAMLGAGSDVSIPSLCNMSTSPGPYCRDHFQAVVEPTATIARKSTQMAAKFEPAIQAIQRLNVGLMQFASTVDDANITLMQYRLFSDSDFVIYDWLFIYDWVTGKREVISIEGDASSLVLISAMDKPEAFISSTTTVKGETKMIYYMVFFVSCLLSGVGILCCVCTILLHFQVHGSNFLWFNRVVGSIWIGRPLLFVRGVTATLLLSTSQLQPLQGLNLTRFQLQPLAWIHLCIVAGEATWVLYVVHDFMTVFLQTLTPTYGPLHCLIVWLALVAVEITSPVRPEVTLNLQCTSNMDSYVQCTTGHLQIGSVRRLGFIFGVQAATCVGSIMFVWFVSRHRNVPQRHTRHILGIADAFFSHIQGDDDSVETIWAMDRVACIMVGLVTLSWRGQKYIFDVKLWVLERDRLSTPAVNLFKLYHDGSQSVVSRARAANTQLPPSTAAIASKHPRLKLGLRLVVIGLGISSVVVAIASSVSYLQVSQVNLANDLFWATFNMTGAHAFLANWFNEQLVLGVSKIQFELNAEWVNRDGAFDLPTATVQSSINFGSRMHYTELWDIESAIAGLRTTDACLVPWIFTPYCFVDFHQRWEMANTAARQQRCQSMVSNGAVFLESVLRNVDCSDFEACWGREFKAAIADELATSQDGQKWLVATTRTSGATAIADEVQLWTTYNIVRFETQWQNFKHLGLVNTYSVTSMLGMDYPFSLQYQISDFRTTKQTTYKMYWGFANDLIALMSNTTSVDGHSLIRSSPTFAFANTSLQTVMIQNGTLTLPLGAAFTLLSATVVGPFGSIDMHYVECPRQAKLAVLLIYQSLRRALSTGGNATQAAFSQISLAWSINPAPKAWTDANFVAVGGSPLCPDYSFASSTPITSGFSILTSWEFQCFQTSSFLNPSKEAMVASVVLSNLTLAATSTCAQSFALASSCLLFLNQTSTFLTTYFTPADLHVLTIASMDATVAIRALNVEFMQYGKLTPTSPLTLYRMNALDPVAPEFTFYAWLYLVDWTLGFREAVSFQGDVGTLAVLTDYLDPLTQQVNLSGNWVNVSLYLRHATLYVTYAMITLGSLVLTYIFLCYGHIEVLNLFLLERMGAIVWVGRPLLFVRSLAAIGLLATCSLQLQTTGFLSYFEVIVEPIYITLLAANEVTWLVAIVNDIGLVFTQEFTAKYAGWDSLFVWVVTALISVMVPVTHTASIQKQCSIVQIDFQIECRSGNVVIGHLSRLYTLITIVVVSNVIFYFCSREWLRWRPSAMRPVTSIFLYGGGKFLFRKADWMHNGVYYMDRMSAVLNGILTVRVGHTIYAMDIKLWITFSVELPESRDGDTPIERKRLNNFIKAAFPVPQVG
ncbi:Aste57867_2424 [Aphanomyces stellatus]|uniref:Aste57867_2424 protein n=1 Tax=Aphanomyces stellatus TaxID=120398 RepID=A0A485KA36_9STRA|nr:hypothetical protein As57867_002418 [Aphanomyces stellatus]VFT79625.1 Aste57867_2424 [Aphanomyces stellatus]